jgi:hypothetical protein
MIRIKDKFHPDPKEHEIYKYLFNNVFNKIFGKLLPLYKKNEYIQET